MPLVEVQGHRGYGSLAPHNTLSAFQKAAANPEVQSVEFDVRVTSDGQLVVTHGPEIGPEIAKATFAELQAVDLGDGERVPLLADVVDTCLAGNLVMNVEIKPGASEEETLKTIALLRHKKALPFCRISSFDRGILKTVLKAAPEVPIGALYHMGSRPIDPTDPAYGSYFEKEPEDFATWFADHKVEGDSVNLRAEAVLRDVRMLDQAREAGKKVLVWFPCSAKPAYDDSEAVYRRLIDLGVDGICCNRPDILIELVKGGKDAAASATEGKPNAAAVLKRPAKQQRTS